MPLRDLVGYHSHNVEIDVCIEERWSAWISRKCISCDVLVPPFLFAQNVTIY